MMFVNQSLQVRVVVVVVRKDFKIVFRNSGMVASQFWLDIFRTHSPAVLSTLEKNHEVLECLGAVEAAMQKQWQQGIGKCVSKLHDP